VLVAQLSEWLLLMLAEIARKQEERRRGDEEQEARIAQTPRPEPQATPSS
jgi:hypothetical protein